MPMDKNRIRGQHSRASWQRAAKPISIKANVGKSGGGALKAVELTTGDLLHVVDTRLRRERSFLNVQQKSAKGIVGHVVGKANEALQSRKAESTARQSRERWTKARTIGEASRWHDSRVQSGRRTS